MAVGHQDHGGVPVGPAVALGSREQSFNFSLGQVLTGPKVGIGGPLGSNCSIFSVRGDQAEVRFGHGFRSFSAVNCSYNDPITNSMQEHITVQCRTGPLSRGSPFLKFPMHRLQKSPSKLRRCCSATSTRVSMGMTEPSATLCPASATWIRMATHGLVLRS